MVPLNSFFFVFLLALLSHPISVRLQTGPSDLESIVRGRCSQWALRNGKTKFNCDAIWKQFLSIITDSKLASECVMKPANYDPLVDVMFSHQTVIPNPFLWSQTFSIMNDMCTNVETCLPLEQSFTGYVFNGLDWCDPNLTNGVQYKTSCGCGGKDEFVYAFWKSASNTFSKFVSGTVHMVLNGSVVKPFDENRLLGKIEVPNLAAPKVTKVVAYLVDSLSMARTSSTCDSPSMLELQKILTNKRIPYECIENPEFVTLFQCSRKSPNEACPLQCNMKDSANMKKLTLYPIFIMVGLSLLSNRLF